jgi:methylenetetrahydrofolate reductase (NADPH)
VTVSDQSPRLAALLSKASVEISSRGHQVAQLSDHFGAGTDVTITFLPGDNYRHNIETAAALRRAGYNPVPHLAARECPRGKHLTISWRGHAAKLTCRAFS